MIRIRINCSDARARHPQAELMPPSPSQAPPSDRRVTDGRRYANLRHSGRNKCLRMSCVTGGLNRVRPAFFDVRVIQKTGPSEKVAKTGLIPREVGPQVSRLYRPTGCVPRTPVG